MFQQLPSLIDTSTTELITDAEAFGICRIYTPESGINTHPDYGTIQVLKNGAIAAAETTVNHCIRIKTWEYLGYCFPQEFLIRKFPFKELVSIKYYDEANKLQTLPDTNYEIVRVSRGYVKVIFKGTLPLLFDRSDAVKLQFTAGTDELLGDYKLAVLLIISKFYDDRSNGKHTMPTAADNLLRPHRKNNF